MVYKLNRRKHGKVTLTFLLSLGVSQVQRIGDEITKILVMENVNAEDL